MKTNLKNRFEFLKIDDSFKCNFNPADNISDFHAEAVGFCGDVISGGAQQYFWIGGKYCWYVDKYTCKIAAVWQTANGILMYEDSEGNLYRVIFKHS